VKSQEEKKWEPGMSSRALRMDCRARKSAGSKIASTCRKETKKKRRKPQA